MTLSPEQITELKTMINSALQKLYIDDFYLINRHVNERAVVFRFGLYFNVLLRSSSFLEYNFDCEYNRNMGDPKRTENFPNGVIPDILLHRRNSNEENILVIEFKGYWSYINREKDRIKLYDFTNQQYEFKYGLGAFVDLNTTFENTQITYFINGEQEQ